MIIAVDFDGTLCEMKYPEIGTIKPYARDVMKKLKEDGHYIIIWTCRTKQHLIEAVNWLLANDIPFDRINDHNPDNAAKYGDAGQKVYAHLYIDDKQIYGLPTWPEIYDFVRNTEEKYFQSKNFSFQ